MSHKYKDAAQLAKRHGFKFWKRCKSSHELWKHPNGSTLLISHCGSRDGRALANLRSELKRKTQ